MNVKENKKQNEKKISEIKPGTLFKYGDSYFIRTSNLYRRNETITGFSLCCNSSPELNYNEWYEPIEAICVLDGKPMGFRYCELVEVFPDAFIAVGDK